MKARTPMPVISAPCSAAQRRWRAPPGPARGRAPAPRDAAARLRAPAPTIRRASRRHPLFGRASGRGVGVRRKHARTATPSPSTRAWQARRSACAGLHARQRVDARRPAPAKATARRPRRARGRCRSDRAPEQTCACGTSLVRLNSRIDRPRRPRADEAVVVGDADHAPALAQHARDEDAQRDQHQRAVDEQNGSLKAIERVGDRDDAAQVLADVLAPGRVVREPAPALPCPPRRNRSARGSAPRTGPAGPARRCAATPA